MIKKEDTFPVKNQKSCPDIVVLALAFVSALVLLLVVIVLSLLLLLLLLLCDILSPHRGVPRGGQRRPVGEARGGLPDEPAARRPHRGQRRGIRGINTICICIYIYIYILIHLLYHVYTYIYIYV